MDSPCRFHTLIGGIIHVLMLTSRGNTVCRIWVIDNNISVAAHRQRPFGGVHTEEAGGLLGQQLHELIGGDAPCGHPGGVEEDGAVLHPGYAVGNFGEVVPAQLLGPAEVEGAVVGAHRVDLSAG